MPVNWHIASREELHPVAGLTLGYAHAGIKKPNRKDVLLVQLAEKSTVAGVFTTNRFCAAPVQLCQKHLATQANIRALIINTGNANAGTGADGLARAQAVCDALAAQLGCASDAILPFSTGVTLEPLPHQKIIDALPEAHANSSANLWVEAAEAIMTTDIVPKARSVQVVIAGETITVTGIAKGSGMIHPNMATMLGFVATDAAVSAPILQTMLQEITATTFNCVTVDGDTSTNDSFVLIATGQKQLAVTEHNSDDYQALKAAILQVATPLAQALARDGEGATKFMTMIVEGGKDVAECKQIAYAMARSPLVKTAFFASDPNLGRLLAAIGYAGVQDLDTAALDLYLDDVLVATDGGRAPDYTEAQGQAVMQQSEIGVRVVLHGRGTATATVWTCDFSYDYVKINADYRS